MSDLSRMLDDLYAVPETGTSEAVLTKAPAWASEEALDEVFSSWVPGPSEDASATERSMVSAAAMTPSLVVDEASADTWLHETEPVVEEPVAAVAGPARWVPAHDDILPARRGPRRGRRRG
jgi:hypothetical protein